MMTGTGRRRKKPCKKPWIARRRHTLLAACASSASALFANQLSIGTDAPAWCLFDKRNSDMSFVRHEGASPSSKSSRVTAHGVQEKVRTETPVTASEWVASEWKQLFSRFFSDSEGAEMSPWHNLPFFRAPNQFSKVTESPSITEAKTEIPTKGSSGLREHFEEKTNSAVSSTADFNTVSESVKCHGYVELGVRESLKGSSTDTLSATIIGPRAKELRPAARAIPASNTVRCEAVAVRESLKQSTDRLSAIISRARKTLARSMLLELDAP